MKLKFWNPFRRIKPGEFGDLEMIDEPCESEEEIYSKEKPVFSDNLIANYELFRDNINSPKRVLYPSCDLDASPVRAFPDAQVDLVDINEHAVGALNRNGVNAIHSDINEYKPSELYDLLILLNSCIPSEEATPFVDSGGYVLANNYSKNASQLVENSDFESVGTICDIPLKKVKGVWTYDHKLIRDKMVDLGETKDNLWIFRRRE